MLILLNTFLNCLLKKLKSILPSPTILLKNYHLKQLSPFFKHFICISRMSIVSFKVFNSPKIFKWHFYQHHPVLETLIYNMKIFINILVSVKASWPKTSAEKKFKVTNTLWWHRASKIYRNLNVYKTCTNLQNFFSLKCYHNSYIAIEKWDILN